MLDFLTLRKQESNESKQKRVPTRAPVTAPVVPESPKQPEPEPEVELKLEVISNLPVATEPKTYNVDLFVKAPIKIPFRTADGAAKRLLIQAKDLPPNIFEYFAQIAEEQEA